MTTERKILGPRFLIKVTGPGCGRGRFVESRCYLTPWRCQARKFENAEDAEGFRATLVPSPRQTTNVESWDQAWHEELPDHRWVGCPKIARAPGEASSTPPATPPVPQAESWSLPISLRIPTQRLELIERAAQVTGTSRTEFILENATRAAVDVLLDRRLFALDEARYEAFEKALDTPPQGPALAKDPVMESSETAAVRLDSRLDQGSETVNPAETTLPHMNGGGGSVILIKYSGMQHGRGRYVSNQLDPTTGLPFLTPWKVQGLYFKKLETLSDFMDRIEIPAGTSVSTITVDNPKVPERLDISRWIGTPTIRFKEGMIPEFHNFEGNPFGLDLNESGG